VTHLDVASALNSTGWHAEEVVFRVVEFTQADVEGDDGSDETEGTTSITQVLFAIRRPVAASKEEVGETPEEGEESERNVPHDDTDEEEECNNEPDDKEETKGIPLDGVFSFERVGTEDKKTSSIRDPEGSVESEKG